VADGTETFDVSRKKERGFIWAHFTCVVPGKPRPTMPPLGQTCTVVYCLNFCGCECVNSAEREAQENAAKK
jgi:hypothetical protein